MSKNNHIHLIGRLASTIAYDHESHGKSVYLGYISSLRTSGTKDVLKVVFPESCLSCWIDKDNYIVNNSCHSQPINPGPLLEIGGEVRTHNWTDENGKSHLSVYVYAQSVNELLEANHDDTVTLIGYIVKQCEVRNTPAGKTLCDTIIAVNRPTQSNRNDYVPVIAWNQTAHWLADCAIGDKIQLKGRFQSRTYSKGDEERIAYEVSIYTATEYNGSDDETEDTE